MLDLWASQWRQRHARSDVIVVRYADDSVGGGQDAMAGSAVSGAVAGTLGQVRFIPKRLEDTAD